MTYDADGLTIAPGDLVRVRRRSRSIMLRVETVEGTPSGYLRLSGPRVRQSDHALLSNVRRCELRRAYLYEPVERVTRVKRGDS